MKQTTNYQLPQWEESDRIRMEDFNGAMEKLDAALGEQQQVLANLGNCSVMYGRYYGSGGYGSDRPNKLSFNRQPIAVLLDFPYILVQGKTTTSADNSGGITVTWSENTVSWWSGANARDQCNAVGYHYYVAFLKND